MSPLVLLEEQGPLARLRLNRPERHNSLIPALLDDLLAHLDHLQRRPELRVVILDAAGRSFSTGGDVRAFAERDADRSAYAAHLVGQLNAAIRAMIALPVPIIAAVHGIVTGGALGLVLAADLVLVTPAVSFTPFYTTVGFSPDGGWSALLPLLVGARRAAQALLLDMPISAEQAVAWGLASELVAPELLPARAAALAEAIAARPPGSVQRTKRLLWQSLPDLDARLEAERQAFVAQIATPEATTGMRRFLDQLAQRKGGHL
ncbi:enoyl-CoA hydratase/isomerase family protein [Kallotenue papyrolyticum]|uniref:enoyl-CoA hydratase/isomerase family protein n=1 Tax=Kallotenue papyrolyticum TaxID=1325125 RepID=UPI000471CF47|nr:enoyl-CoA hydratase/isomerase family protein [Kallotenue papyrolyticum]